MKIVFIHGWNQNKEVWNEIIEHLDLKAIAIDLPGFGNQKLISKNWGVPEYARWLTQRIVKFKPAKKSIILIGHSFGGKIATQIASKKPRWLKALILSGSPSIHRPEIKTKILIFIYKILKAFIPKKFKPIFLPKELKRAYFDGLDQIFRKVVNYDQTLHLSKIDVPTLLIWGGKDSTVPINIPKEMTNSIKNSKLLIIDKAGHNLFIDNPIFFAGYVKKFINEIK